jgi:hypothetical protein
MAKIIYLLFIPFIFANDSFTITEQPSHVFQGSTQTITWETNLTLTEVKIELYRDSSFVKKLGETNQNSRTYAWHVSDQATCGTNYFIKVSVKASNGKSAWANTQTFSIVDNFNPKDLLWLLLLILCCAPYCIKRCNRNYGSYKEPMLPVAYQVQPGATATPPAYAQQTYVSNQTSSGGNGRSAAAGFAAGVAVDELLHHNNHTSWFDTNNSGGGGGGGSDWGGGDFGSSFFGGGGGDTSGGFS